MYALPSEVERAVIEIVASIDCRETAELSLDSPFYEDTGSDTIELLDLSVRLEKHFGVHVPVQEMIVEIAGRDVPERWQQIQEKFTVGVIVRLVEACLRNAHGQ